MHTPNVNSRLTILDTQTGSIAQSFPGQPFDEISGAAFDLSTDTLLPSATSVDLCCKSIEELVSFLESAQFEWIGGGVRDLYIQPGTNDLYGITLLGDLVRLDKVTADISVIGSDSIFGTAHGLAFSADGKLFAAEYQRNRI